MFGGDLYRHYLLRVALFSAAFALGVCLSQQQDVQDELQDKHVTSPLIEGPDFQHIGDMTIFRGQYEADEVGIRQERHVTIRSSAKWPQGIVPYTISSQFTERQRQVIYRAMEHWEAHTCIDFRPRLSSDVYSIRIMRDSGCYSFVGRTPRRYQPQGVSLGSGCVRDYIVIHELGHAIGFYHEHTRPDRDQYIDVIYDNIAGGVRDQFYKVGPGETDTLGLGYDLQSIMHYDRNTFSRNGLDTIQSKVPGASVGNARQLSTLDIAKANKFYNCVPPTTPPPCGGVLNTASGSFQTPNWPSTYPVNVDCEWRIQLPDARKLVELKCDHQPFGIAGDLPGCNKDYLKIYDGHSTQDGSHGPYCHYTAPEVLKMSSNLAMAVFHAGPSHNPSRRGFRCTFQSVEAPTTLPPTPPPTTPPPCGGVLNTASGSFQTPNWPSTYPINVDCEWRIQLPDARKLVELKCDHQPFGIAGDLPGCDKDYLKFYDGHSTQDGSHGPYCHYTAPEVLKMSSNLAMAVFHAGPSHSSSRRGFRCTFQSVEAPTPPTTLPPIPPPSTPSPTMPSPCGGELKTASGSFQSPNWPITYPVNLDCQWTIELPNHTKLVEIDCNNEPFGIAGSLPACDKDYLKFYDGHSTQDTFYGPYCYFTKPETVKMTSNLAMAVFHAGPSHSPSRLGFKCTFRSVDGPTTPPPPSPITTLPPPSTKAPSPPTTSVSLPTTTVSPLTPSTTLPPPSPSPGACPLKIVPTNLVGTYQCDSFMLTGTYFGLPGFPSFVEQSSPSDCDWTIVSAARNTNYQVRITYFDLPASSDCSSHSLAIYDGLNESSQQLAKLCGDICEERVFQLSGDFAFVKVHMATRPGTFRGFQAIVEEIP